VIGPITQNDRGAFAQMGEQRYLHRIKTLWSGGTADIWRHLMTVRTSRKSVTFTQPFSLTGFDEVQPAGTYTVETDEELLPGLSFPAYRRVATLIFLRSRGVEEVVNIDPLELKAAQERDAGRHTLADPG
jgi:hypothetical protein